MTAPILLIHGLFGSLNEPRIVSAFGGVNVIAPDLIGYGVHRSDPRTTWSLAEQADHVASHVRRQNLGPVHVVGHSVGGAVAIFFAHRHPELTRSVTSVEGNFTLGDAFWSQKISTRSLPEIEREVSGFRADVTAWLARAGVAPTPWTLRVAAAWLDHQPAATLRAQALAVVNATKEPEYLAIVRNILHTGAQLHLLAGARSRSGWNVPEWLSAHAASQTEIPDTGHLMMLESPAAFANAILKNLL